jgi:hypothetical protein
MDCPANKNGYKKFNGIGLGRAQNKALGQETARHEGKKQLERFEIFLPWTHMKMKR